MNDLNDCSYKRVINYYYDLNINNKEVDVEISKIRLRRLYELYYGCDAETRKRFVHHIESILSNRFGISISLERRIDKTIELGIFYMRSKKDDNFFGEILPVLLVLEKELVFVSTGEANKDDNIDKWTYDYLSRYAKLKLDKEDCDAYDVLDAYARSTDKKREFISAIIKVKIKATMLRFGNKVRRIIWTKF